MDTGQWLENIGNLRFVDDNQCVWEAPSIMVSEKYLCVTSPTFYRHGRIWRLAKIQDWLYLWNEDHYPTHDVCNVTLAVEGKDGLDAWSCKGDAILADHGFGGQLPFTEYGNFIPKYNDRYGCTKIICKIQKSEIKPSDENPLSSDTTNENDNSRNSEEKEEPKIIKVKGLERLVQNLKSLLIDEKNSDVTLKAGDQEFRVHKLILEARAPTFTSMMQLDMQEKTSGVVDIPDCTAESFEVFLLYIYTGAAETMSSDNVFNLYYAADKFSVDDLKEDCVQFMKDYLSVENICDVVALSLMHGDNGLLKDATDFFRRNMRKIVKTKKWQTFMQENSEHANELLVKALDA